MYAPKYGSHTPILLQKGTAQHIVYFSSLSYQAVCQTGLTAFLHLRKLPQEQMHLWLPGHSNSNKGSIST